MEEELLDNVEELGWGDGDTMTVEDITVVEANEELAIMEDEESNRDIGVEENCGDVVYTDVGIADEAEDEAGEDEDEDEDEHRP